MLLCSHLLDVLHEQEKSANSNCGRNDSTSSPRCKIETQDNEVTSSTEPTESTIKRWITEEDLTEGLALRRKTQSLADFPQGENFILLYIFIKSPKVFLYMIITFVSALAECIHL